MSLFCLMILSVFYVTTIEATELKYTIDDVYNLVSRIDENIRKEDRMREITQFIRIDDTLKKLEKRVNEIAEKMNADEDDLGRSTPSDLSDDLKIISDRIQKMENTTESLRTMISKMDKDLGKLDEMEQKTNKMDKDLEHRLTKLMNAISSLHEMNKGLKDQLRSDKRNEGGKSLGSDGITYLTDALEGVQKKVQEQLSVLSVQLRKELDSLKIMASNAFVQCESSDENEEIAKPHKTSVQMDALVYNLSRSQREIREELHLGMQGLEQKLTELTSSNAKCAEESKVIGVRSSEVPPKCVSDQFVRDALSCAELRKSGTTCDGIYSVFHSSGQVIKLYCDMTTDGGGWTVIMRRGDFGSAPVNFSQPWRIYKQGFGNMKEEFWLGNDNIRMLTAGSENNQLRIDLKSTSFHNNFIYNSFLIDHEDYRYGLHISDPIGKSLPYFTGGNNVFFVTYDRADRLGRCALQYKSGWWYQGSCFTYPVLTAERYRNQNDVSTFELQARYISPHMTELLKGAEMKIRPQNFRV